MKNHVREKLLAGGRVLGTFFESGSENIAECIGLGGFDYMVIDAEHGPFGPERAAAFIRAALLRGCTPFVRVQDTGRASLLKMLDVGAQGLIVPCIQSAAEAQRLVEYAKYHPQGARGFAFGRDAGWGFAPHAQLGTRAYFEICNRESLLIPQCETRGALEEIEKIAATEGVDGIFVGPFDLSAALDAPADFAAPAFKEALMRVLAACRAAQKPCFVYAPNLDAARLRFAEGFQGVSLAMDTVFLVEALQAARERLGL